MSISSAGKYVASIATVVVFLGSEYTFLHQHKINIAIPPVLHEQMSDRTTQHTVSMHSLSRDEEVHDALSAATSNIFPSISPIPTQGSLVAKTATTTTTPTPFLSPVPTSQRPSPTITPDCILHGNDGCGVVGQTVVKLKQGKQSVTNLTKSIGL